MLFKIFSTIRFEENVVHLVHERIVVIVVEYPSGPSHVFQDVPHLVE